LETSACIIYSVNVEVKSRGRKISAKDPYSQVLHDFFSYCRRESIPLITTKTVRDESSSTLAEAVVGYCRRSRIRSNAVILHLFAKCNQRLHELINKKSKKESPKVSINIGRSFYQKFKHDKRLIELKKRKRRDTLLPEKGDMKIVSEAAKLAEDSNYNLFLLSNDGDFIEFSEELKKEFGFTVLAVSDLPSIMRAMKS
jgi:hypothetical protein